MQGILRSAIILLFLLAFPGIARADTMEGLIGWWKLDEASGTVAADAASDSHGTLINGPTWQPTSGKIGGALQFDGTSHRIQLGIPSWYSSGAMMNKTLSAWFKLSAFRTTGRAGILTAGVANPNGFTLRLDWDASGNAKPNFKMNSVDVLSSQIIPSGDTGWHHIAVSIDSTIATIIH